MVLHLFSKTRYPRTRHFADAHHGPPIMFASDTGEWWWCYVTCQWENDLKSDESFFIDHKTSIIDSETYGSNCKIYDTPMIFLCHCQRWRVQFLTLKSHQTFNTILSFISLRNTFDNTIQPTIVEIKSTLFRVNWILRGTSIIWCACLERSQRLTISSRCCTFRRHIAIFISFKHSQRPKHAKSLAF